MEALKKSVEQTVKWGFPVFKGKGVIINTRAETVEYLLKSNRYNITLQNLVF